LIQGTFQLGQDLIQVVVRGNELMFYDISTGTITTIEGLKLDFSGVIKEFPDLKDEDEWRKKAIERLKTHMKKFDKEMDKLNYVKNELVKFGWKALYFQKAGFRPMKFNVV
jgi:GTP1/Obg family GTP-binding protein